MRIRGYDLTKSQLGWICDVYFTVCTINQFADEEHIVSSGGKYFLTALWNGYNTAKKEASKIEATPEQRKALGWN